MGSSDEIDFEDKQPETEDMENENEVLTHDELEAEMNETISDVEAILEVKKGVCRILLHKYKWNKESLLERFYEHPDTNAFLIAAHVIPRSSEEVPPGEAECDICCELAYLTGLACNHRACNSCWESYLTNKIVDDRQSEIQCMAPDCELLLEDEQVYFYISDGAVLSNYRNLVLNSYVETNRLLRWCPGVDCQKAVKVSHCEPCLAVCSCGQKICFACGLDWHEPINCELIKVWLRKTSDDPATAFWISEHTKECPKCSMKIEKRGGCNHMMCTSPGCHHHFCWICLGEWGINGYETHSCNRFQEEEETEKKKKKCRKVERCPFENRHSISRFLFYFDRYNAHEQSLRLEENLNTTTATKMEQMQQLSMSWIEVQFIRKAVDVLLECRRTLMYTYAFAFFLKKDNNSMIFENNQNDLEVATEQLSGFLEQDLENENLVTLKQKVQDKYRYVERRRKILMDHWKEGAEQGIWRFNKE